MKKVILKIMVCAMALLLCFSATGCKGGDWKGTTMKNWGAIDYSTNGGFLVETQNYVYLINGMGTSTEDNSFGAPIKGALVAVDKADLSKSQIVVPKLMVAADYSAGISIFGSGNNAYVYYGTPSTEKNSQGNVANDTLTFMRTKLDGSASDTYFTAEALNVQYRFVEVGGKVYILYHDASENALKCYDTSSKKEIVVAKTDAKTNVKTEEEYRTLGAYYFVDGVEGVSVIYTTTVYSEEYIKDKASSDNYTRETVAYNQVYSFTPGDAKNGAFYGKEIVNGKQSLTTYAIKAVEGADVYFTETLANGKAKTFTAKVNAFATKEEIKQDTLIADTTFIVSPNEAYYVEGGKVYKTDLTKNSFNDQLVLIDDNAKTIKAVIGNEIFFINDSQNLFKKVMNDGEAKTVKVFDNMVATAWYDYEIVNTADGKLLFAADGTSTSSNYVKCVNIDKAYASKDTDEDGEDDSFYLEGAQVVGVMTEGDRAQAVKDMITQVSTKSIDGKSDTIDKIVSDYAKLSKEAKKSFGDTYSTKYEQIKKANDIAKVLVQLEDVVHTDLTTTEKDALKVIYNNAKAKIEKLGDEKATILGYLEGNLNFYYQKAGEVFSAK